MENNIGGFINCLCTYLTIVYREYFKTDEYLEFLIDKKIILQGFKVAKNIKQENPWVYQPYIIGNIEEEKVYQSMFEQYADFLKEITWLYVKKRSTACMKRKNICIT